MTNQPQTELDEIFVDYKVHNKDIDMCFNDAVAVAQIKQAILDWHNKQVLEIIGEDEPVSDNIYNTPEGAEYYINQERHKAYRNELREQQRAKFKESE